MNASCLFSAEGQTFFSFFSIVSKIKLIFAVGNIMSGMEEKRMMSISIIGTGKIVGEVLEMLRQERLEVRVDALFAHCNLERAYQLSDEYGIAKVYTDYAKLLKETTSDFIYIANVNDQHYPYAVQALQANRNLIIEKPICLTAPELDRLIQMAKERGLFLFEAMTFRHMPNFEALREDVARIGQIRLVEANFSQYSSRYDQYKKGVVLPAFDPAHAGGALLDLNIYNISLVTALFGRPDRSCYYPNKGFNGVDTSGTMMMQYADFVAVCSAAKDAYGDSHFMIEGEKGFIRINGAVGVFKEYELHVHGEAPVVVNRQAQGTHRLSYEFVNFIDIYSRRDTRRMDELLEQAQKALTVLSCF